MPVHVKWIPNDHSNLETPYQFNHELGRHVPVTLDSVYMDIWRDTGGLLFDPMRPEDVYDGAEQRFALDALVSSKAKLPQAMDRLKTIMEKASGTIKPVSYTILDPIKKKGSTQIVVVFDLSDGQTVSIYFHNPDSTPDKIADGDELVAWKWLLNKSDVTIAVAPEGGQFLSRKSAGARIMQLAEKGSIKFKERSKVTADNQQLIEDLSRQVNDKKQVLDAKLQRVAELEAMPDYVAPVVEEPSPEELLQSKDDQLIIEQVGKFLESQGFVNDNGLWKNESKSVAFSVNNRTETRESSYFMANALNNGAWVMPPSSWGDIAASSINFGLYSKAKPTAQEVIDQLQSILSAVEASQNSTSDNKGKPTDLSNLNPVAAIKVLAQLKAGDAFITQNGSTYTLAKPISRTYSIAIVPKEEGLPSTLVPHYIISSTEKVVRDAWTKAFDEIEGVTTPSPTPVPVKDIRTQRAYLEQRLAQLEDAGYWEQRAQDIRARSQFRSDPEKLRSIYEARFNKVDEDFLSQIKGLEAVKPLQAFKPSEQEVHDDVIARAKAYLDNGGWKQYYNLESTSPSTPEPNKPAIDYPFEGNEVKWINEAVDKSIDRAEIHRNLASWWKRITDEAITLDALPKADYDALKKQVFSTLTSLPSLQGDAWMNAVKGVALQLEKLSEGAVWTDLFGENKVTGAEIMDELRRLASNNQEGFTEADEVFSAYGNVVYANEQGKEYALDIKADQEGLKLTATPLSSTDTNTIINLEVSTLDEALQVIKQKLDERPGQLYDTEIIDAVSEALQKEGYAVVSKAGEFLSLTKAFDDLSVGVDLSDNALEENGSTVLVTAKMAAINLAKEVDYIEIGHYSKDELIDPDKIVERIIAKVGSYIANDYADLLSKIQAFRADWDKMTPEQRTTLIEPEFRGGKNKSNKVASAIKLTSSNLGDGIVYRMMQRYAYQEIKKQLTAATDPVPVPTEPVPTMPKGFEWYKPNEEVAPTEYNLGSGKDVSLYQIGRSYDYVKVRVEGNKFQAQLRVGGAQYNITKSTVEELGESLAGYLLPGMMIFNDGMFKADDLLKKLKLIAGNDVLGALRNSNKPTTTPTVDPVPTPVEPTPEPTPAMNPHVETLQAFINGEWDDKSLDEINKIFDEMDALEAAGLSEQYDELLGKAAEKYAELDKKLNG